MAEAAPEREVIGAVELARSTGISYRRIDYWTRQGWLTPTRPGHGSGYARAYDATDVDLLIAVSALTGAGVMPESAFRLARKVIAEGHVTIGPFLLCRPIA